MTGIYDQKAMTNAIERLEDVALQETCLPMLMIIILNN